MCTLNFAPILAGYNNKSKINNLKLCLLVIKISANTNKLNVDFLNLKIEWQGDTFNLYNNFREYYQKTVLCIRLTSSRLSPNVQNQVKPKIEAFQIFVIHFGLFFLYNFIQNGEFEKIKTIFSNIGSLSLYEKFNVQDQKCFRNVF